MKKRLVLCISILVTTAMMLTGCGSTPATKSTSTAPTQTSSQVSKPKENTEQEKSNTQIQEVTMYAPDGRTRVTKSSEVSDYQKVGWYTEPVQTMYAPDGRTRVTKSSEVSDYQKVGWYTEPVQTMYAPDGRTRVTKSSEVSDYQKVGWYTSKSAAKQHAPSHQKSTSTSNKGLKASTASNDKNTLTVYITKTGSKYHRSGCRYLSCSCYPISLSSAKNQGYSPCSRCTPLE